MDPVTLVVAALGTAIAVMGQVTLSEAAKDAYHNLKTLLGNRFSADPKHTEALAAFEKDPEGKATDLASAVNESKAHEDPAIKEAAEKLLAQTDPEGQAAGKYHLLIKGNVQGLVQGDHANVTMNFGQPEPKT
jgi:hypothetical protein